MDRARGYYPESMKELDKMTGLSEVKELAWRLLEKRMYDISRNYCDNTRCPNFVFAGNPGTGKSTVARLFSRILKDCGIIKTDKTVIADRAALVAEYIGQTGPKTKKVVESALDGVLFIDEAYSLISESANDFGKEAISTLIKEMEDHKDRLVVIFAGYPDLMSEFMKVNPGLESRISDIVVFRDYSEDELGKIAVEYCRECNLRLTDDGLRAFKRVITRKKYSNRFGNAREVEQIIQKAIQKRASIYCSGTDVWRDIDIITEDCFLEDMSEEDNPEKYLKELNQMVGISDAKKAIHQIIDDAVYTKQDIEMGYLSNSKAFIGGHYCFIGNPGTGKTTVARLFAKTLFAYGITKSDVFIEATRSDLVAGYSGQTAIKTRSLCERAYGGVLFLDEAYSLIQGTNDQFGHEALDTLIKEMEDNRDKLIVIFAGYKKEMEAFLSANSGLRSRITETVEFDDYNESELLSIFINIEDGHNIICSPESQPLIRKKIHDIYIGRDEFFGNGREMRKLFEEIYGRTKSRVVREHITDPHERHLIRKQDVA